MWWDNPDLDDDTDDLQTRLEREGLGNLQKLKEEGDERKLARRQEIIEQFNKSQCKQMIRNEYIWQQEREEELLWKEKQKRLAEEERSEKLRKVRNFLEQAHPAKREAEPQVLEGVRAAPLAIDLATWEAPVYKKRSSEKKVLKNTAKDHFLFQTPSSSSTGGFNTGIAPGTVKMLIDAFEPVRFKKGEVIVREGDMDEYLYVVEKKTVEFPDDKNNKSTNDEWTTIGDQNLLHVLPAGKTVVATESTKVFRLHQETYRAIVQQAQAAAQASTPKASSSFSEEKKDDDDDDDVNNDEEWWLDSEAAQHNRSIMEALEEVEKDDLERIKVLGEGQFGEVWLVAADLKIGKKAKAKRYEFALKLQETYDDYRLNTAVSELKIMKEVSESGHPFVSMLYRSYDDTEESKDMLLGLIPGGELWDNIHKEDEANPGEWLSGLSEGASRFYTMVVADTLDYLHSRSYVFRDLKPENIMLDGYGYPVIVDFGFCKRLPEGPDGKTFTFCGTPNYVAPEIITNVGHNGKADCWALGIVIYEMVSGMNPFFWEGIDNVDLFRSICSDDGEPLEKHHSALVRGAVDGLLAKDPSERMSARDLLGHAWFEGLSLKRLRKRQIKAPWIPPGGEGEKAKYFSDCFQNSRKREQELEERLTAVEKTLQSNPSPNNVALLGSPIRMSKQGLADLVKPVPKGIVSERMNSVLTKPIVNNTGLPDLTPTRKNAKGLVSERIRNSTTLNGRNHRDLPIITPTRKNMEKGAVAKRINAAKSMEKPGKLPSLFANFPRLET